MTATVAKAVAGCLVGHPQAMRPTARHGMAYSEPCRVNVRGYRSVAI